MRPLTAAICCSRDRRVLRLVDALSHEGVPVTVGLTNDPVVEAALAERRVPYCIVERGSHALTANAAVELVSVGSDVLLLDSDCVVSAGAPLAVRRALCVHDIVRLPIRFADSGSWISRNVARYRTFDDTYENPSHKPGLGLSARVLSELAPLFDTRLRRGADAELSWRLRRMGLRPAICSNGWVLHDVTTLRHLLASSMWFGADDAIRQCVLGQRDAKPGWRWEIARYRAMLRDSTAPAPLVVALSDIAYHLGWGLRRPFTKRGKQ